MKQNPPHATDWSTIARIKRIGLEPGKSFDATVVNADVLANGVADAKKLIEQKAPTIARSVNGWQMNTDTMGVYSESYYLKRRTIVALAGLGANQDQLTRSIRSTSPMPTASASWQKEQICAAFRQGRNCRRSTRSGR